tara:strand:- start:1674 stop:1832 length:159 start_codon:yes stop_codon:yes gene_type:complete
MKQGKMSTIRFKNNRRKGKIEWKKTRRKLENKLEEMTEPRHRKKIDGIWTII